MDVVQKIVTELFGFVEDTLEGMEEDGEIEEATKEHYIVTEELEDGFLDWLTTPGNPQFWDGVVIEPAYLKPAILKEASERALTREEAQAGLKLAQDQGYIVVSDGKVRLTEAGYQLACS